MGSEWSALREEPLWRLKSLLWWNYAHGAKPSMVTTLHRSKVTWPEREVEPPQLEYVSIT